MLNKIDIMKELLDRYEQFDTIQDEYIASEVAQYIRKLEIRLAIELVGDEAWKQKN